MIDHIGMKVRDIARATEFYLKALAPLGISIVMEVSAEESGHGAAVGFGANWKPFFWIAQATARRAYAPIITPTTTAPSCSTPTATISRPCATR